MKKVRNIFLEIIIVAVLMQPASSSAQGVFIINTDIEYPENGIILDANDSGGDIKLQFGNTLNKYLQWDDTNQYFSFNDDINLGGNEIMDFKLENLSSPPSCNSASAGRMYHDTTDSKTYVCNGTDWQDVTAIFTTATKVVTVGSSGADYSSIAGAAGYLNSLSGGIILLSAETHTITSAVNLQNITLIGKDANNTTIQISGAGQIDSFDTSFVKTTIDVNSINDTMAIDALSGSSSLYFEWVDLNVQDSGDSLIDSNAATAPNVTVKFVKCVETGGSGTILLNQSGGNLNTSSTIFVDSRSGDNPLELEDWDVTLIGGGNVYTTGIITSVPSNSIFVSPDMNLQGAIDSLEATGNGGLITLLPGVHNISQTITIEGDSIQIVGYGDSSVIAASGFSGITDTTAAIQIGAVDGTAPVDDATLKDFKLEVSSNIHGVRVTGGSSNQILNVTVQKVSGQSGTGATANIGIQLLDGSSEQLIRPVVKNCRVFGNGGTNYFTDGIHVTSDPSISGVWGYNQGVVNGLIEGNNVDYVRETGYAIVGTDNSSLFNNRATQMGAIGGFTGAYGIYVGNCSNINMNANVFSGSLANRAIGIGIESFDTGSLKETRNSIFNNNIINGTGNGGIGFGTGFRVGAPSNTNAFGNSFQNNSIIGASNPAFYTTRAFDVQGNVDDNTFSNNDITGGGNPWDIGIDLQSAAQESNIVSNNRPDNVTTLLSDSGLYTKKGVLHHRDTSNPTANDDINDGYEIGTIWINTSNDTSYVLVDNTSGAAVWNQLDSSGASGATLAQYYDTTGGLDVNVSSAPAIPWNVETREDSGFTHSNTANNTRVILDEAGWYEVFYSVSHESQTNGRKNIRCGIRLNGSTIIAPSQSYAYSRNTTDEWATNTGEALIQTTSANEYYEIICRGEGSGVDSASANTVPDHNWTIVEKK
jgi:hypothetical protein